MVRGVKAILPVIAIAGTVLFSGSAVYAGVNQDAAIDKNKNVLLNTWGNCVRTKWQAGEDPCAPPAPEPEPVVAPAPPPPPPPAPPVPVLSKEQLTIYFDFNSDELTEESIAKLNDLIYAIKASDGNIVHVDIIGFADEIGSKEANIALSERRSNAVNSYLRQYVDIDTRVADIRGLGESNSVTNCKGIKNRTEKIACLAKDRRVEIELRYKHFRY